MIFDRACGLTLVFPEDPRAHELEEATGVEAGPVDGDRVLRTDGCDVYCVKAKKREGTRARADPLTPSYTSAFHECSSFLMNLGGARDKKRLCHA